LSPALDSSNTNDTKLHKEGPSAFSLELGPSRKIK